MRNVALAPSVALCVALIAGACATPNAASPSVEVSEQSIAEEPGAPVEWTPEIEHELLRAAVRVHVEHEHRDAAEIIERAEHARHMQRSGRTDEEALGIRRAAPKHEMLRRQLRRAAEILVDAGKDDLAQRMIALSDDLWDDPLAGTAQERPRRDTANDREIEIVKERMKVMRWGVEIWVEKGRSDLAEQLEYAVLARKMAIERRRDAEANEVREKAPGRGQLAELLHGVGRLYEEKGWETRAAACFELSKVYGEQWRREQEREGAREHRGDDDREANEWRRKTGETLERFMERVERLEVHVKRLAERLEKLEGARDR